MENERESQRFNITNTPEANITTWLEAFFQDRRAQNMSDGTVQFYQTKLKLFIDFCDLQHITEITKVSPADLREYLLWLNQEGHNDGGIHAAYRALRTFLNWWQRENELENWKNPVLKVKAPKLPVQVLEPVPIETVRVLIEVCKPVNFTGVRDRAIFMMLTDTGTRASEFCALNREDVNPVLGTVLIRQGKGRKPRTLFVGKRTRKALRQYLYWRKDEEPALWITVEQERLTYWGLKAMVKRRSAEADVKTPELHAFRRLFAISMLRAGVDIYSLQKLMGHADLQVLQRYLAQTDEDLREAHMRYGPMDHANI